MKKQLQIITRTFAEYAAFAVAGAVTITAQVYFFPLSPSSGERSLEARFVDLVLAPLPLPAEPPLGWENAFVFFVAASFFLAAKPWELIPAFRRKEDS